MDRLKQAYITPESIQETVNALLKKYPEQTVRKCISEMLEDEIYQNDTYQVALRRFEVPGFGGQWVHLSIKRIDREVIHDWRDLQEIKNQLVGEECEGIELYPAESRLVDTANQYHLWCLADPTVRLPIGFESRLVSGEHDDILPDLPNTKQRPR